MHLLVDSTGLKLCGAGEWLVEKHGTRTRRSWRKLHLSVDADTGRIVAAPLTDHDVDDASQVGSLLDKVDGQIASFTGDGAYDQESVYAGVAERHPEAVVMQPERLRLSTLPPRTCRWLPTQESSRSHLRRAAAAADARDHSGGLILGLGLAEPLQIPTTDQAGIRLLCARRTGSSRSPPSEGPPRLVGPPRRTAHRPVLVDRDGIMRWINIEGATKGTAGLEKFPTDEGFLIAAQRLAD